jgi:hypothetical protein
MPDAKEVGAFVHGQGEQTTDLLGEGAIALFFEGGFLGLSMAFTFLVHRESSLEFRAPQSLCRGRLRAYS